MWLITYSSFVWTVLRTSWRVAAWSTKPTKRLQKFWSISDPPKRFVFRSFLHRIVRFQGADGTSVNRDRFLQALFWEPLWSSFSELKQDCSLSIRSHFLNWKKTVWVCVTIKLVVQFIWRSPGLYYAANGNCLLFGGQTCAYRICKKWVHLKQTSFSYVAGNIECAKPRLFSWMHTLLDLAAQLKVIFGKLKSWTFNMHGNFDWNFALRVEALKVFGFTLLALLGLPLGIL